MANNSLGTRGRAENEFYIATLFQPDTGLNFRAWVPESFNINIRSNWEPIFGYFNEVSQGVTRVAQGVGVIPNSKALTRQAWTGTDPLDFQFNFLLDAYEDAYLDVQAPIQDLARMATPTRSGTLLYSPGPTILSDKNRIYLRIGKFFVLDSIVITDIDVTYHTISDQYGQYLAADVNLSVRSHYTPDQADILSYFARGRSGNNDLINKDPTQSAGDAASAIFQGLKNAASSQVGRNGINLF